MIYKRIGIILVAICCCTFFVVPAFGTPTYEMSVNQGVIWGGGGNAVDYLNSTLASINSLEQFVWPGGLTSPIPQFTTPLDGTAVAGYWTFTVTSSTKDTGTPSWNDIMAGGVWPFSIDWSGQVGDSYMSAEFNITDSFANIYAKWAENNPDMYTLFGLFTDPTAGGASDGSVIPTGLFAFAGDASSSFDLSVFANLEGVKINEGSGTMTVVPEPSTMLLLGVGLLGIVGASRRKLKR